MTTPTQGTVRTSYREISLYAPDRTPCRIDLSDNTNAWGLPPSAMRVVIGAGASTVTRYPTLYSADLKEALAEYLGVSRDMLTTGCGSDDVLDSALRACAEPGDRIAYADPTFPAIPIFALMNGLVPVPVRMTRAYHLDVDALLATDARIIYLCSPNNPTGSSLARTSLETIVTAARADQFVIVDEAYAEFAGVTSVDLIGGCDRLLVTRTMSKAFGLAGLRVGYGVGSPALIAEVEKSRGPYKVNALAERAAVAALRDGMDWVREHIVLSNTNRDRLSLEFGRRGLGPVRSAANFVFLPIANAATIARAMRDRGVAVRPFEGLPAISPALIATGGGALRFSVGPWEQLCEALDAFDEARRPCE